MKKFLTLALALVMALGLAAPALAYTTNEALPGGVSPYTVDIYLVDHISRDFLSGWIAMPATDRGYAKNEVISAVGVLNVPANYDVYASGYRQLRFDGTNVTVDVVDNLSNINRNVYMLATNLGTTDYSTAPIGPFTGAVGAPAAGIYWEINETLGSRLFFQLLPPGGLNNGRAIPVVGSSKTYKWLAFGKVTADDAKFCFSLSRAAGFVGTVPTRSSASYPAYAPTFNSWLVLCSNFIVGRQNGTNLGANTYWVFENANEVMQATYWDWATSTSKTNPDYVIGELRLMIETIGNQGVSKRMAIFPDGAGSPSYWVSIEPSTNEVVFTITDYAGAPSGKRVGEQITMNKDARTYQRLLQFYGDIVEDALGFTAFNVGNLLNAADWTGLATSCWDVKECVDVEPWTPYVSVPENIVVDPPKTGDASIMGFVMIALAAAAAVVVRKVRA